MIDKLHKCRLICCSEKYRAKCRLDNMIIKCPSSSVVGSSRLLEVAEFLLMMPRKGDLGQWE